MASNDSTLQSATETLTRLVRSLSKKEVPKASAQDTPANVGGDAAVDPPSHTTRSIPKAKLTAFQRFAKLTSSKKAVFPPTGWFEEPVTPGTAAAAAVPLPPTPGEGGDIRLEDIRLEEPAGSDAINESDNEATPPSGAATPPEPMTLAQRIQALISSLPPFTASISTPGSNTPSETPPAYTSDTPPAYTRGAPQPPPSNTLADSTMTALLSSAAVMNGSISKSRQSVWSALDRLRPNKKGKGKAPQSGIEEVEGDDDNDSVMMYAPLEPDANSEIELADSEMMSVDEDGERIPESSAGDKGKGKENAAPPKEIKVWIPSATKISLQANWWGYRLYLPPPVLDVLSSKQLEATKRAALITASLKWFIDKIPVKVLPLQLRAPAMVLKRLTPYLGYIGAFIAWSWAAIKAFDHGDGVVLTATWILPVALIPSTWDINEVPVHPGPVPITRMPAPDTSTSNGEGSRPETAKNPDVKGKGKAREK